MEASAPEREEEERYLEVRAHNALDPASSERLVRFLYDESWRVRKAAAEQLSRAGPLVVPRLVQVLGDRGQTGARNAAAEALVRLGPAAAEAVVTLLRHLDPDQRKFAADILGEMREAEGIGPLCEALEDEDTNVRVAAAEALGRVGGESAARALERALRRPEPLLRLSVLGALFTLQRPPPLPTLVPLLDDPQLRRTAYRMLGLIPQPAAAELVCRGLGSSASPVREAALAALGLQRARTEPSRRADLEACVRAGVRKVPGFQEVLKRALESEDVSVRAGALFAAGALKDPALAPQVAEAAREPLLAEEATRTLASLGPAAGRELLARMAELSRPAQAAAAEALVALADPSLVEPLAQLAASDEPELRSWAIRALGQSRSPRAVEVLLPLLEEPEAASAAARALVALGETFRAPVREALEARIVKGPVPAAILALARVGGAAALPVLRHTARHPDASVRAASAEAACDVGGEGSLELARIALPDEAPPVRRAAARALGRLAPEGAAPLLKVALADEDPAVQIAAIEAAGHSGAAHLVPELEVLAGAPDGLRALHAVRALAHLGRFSPATFLKAVGHPDPEVVKEALLAGATLTEGVELAVSLLEHRRWDLRAAAARLLGASGGSDCRLAVEAALVKEPDPLAREALTEAAALLARR
ncbi:MAG: HEAT repeat domain-containing protein [Myxococcaceae bacterium]